MAERSPSRIPAPSGLRRSASVRVRGERPLIMYLTSPSPFPSISEKDEVAFPASMYKTPTRSNLRQRSHSNLNLRGKDDDLDSLESFGSNFSGMSKMSTKSSCEHSQFALNGTTFSGRTHKYVVHCSSSCQSPDEYLTPTQRANRNIHRLKTLLQLAKEKLLEKEQEIFKLTKEVVELKVFKASMKNSSYSEASTPSDCKESPREGGPVTFTIEDTHDEFQCDTYADLTPSKTSYFFEDKLDGQNGKSTPASSPLHGYQRDKMSATPDYLLSSLADSGHFDDLASSLSLQSKDSLNHQALFEEKTQDCDNQEERARLVKMYEAILQDRKDAYDRQLRSVQLANEELNMKMVDSFELKLKEEEEKYEEKFNALVTTTEQEKIEIVEQFEKKLSEEKDAFMEKLQKTEGDKTACMYNNDNYLLRVEQEKATYELALSEIKIKFEREKEMIENSFDTAMLEERRKFEESVVNIQLDNDQQLRVLTEKIADHERRYAGLLEKYEGSLEKIAQLEKENSSLKSSLGEQEARQKELYLKMYQKGQEAVQFQHEEASNGAGPSVLPVPELLVQLKVTEVELENLKDNEYRAEHSDAHGVSLISAKEALSLWMLAARKAMYKRLSESRQKPVPVEQPKAFQAGQDPEATLQFLKSAVYYFLTDRDNHLEHLRAIESILGFSQNERRDIASRYYPQ